MPVHHPRASDVSPRRISWPALTPGLVAIVAMIAAVAAVLLYARIGALHGETIRLYAHVQEARGLLRGSEVWLAGQKVGLVADIEFRPAATDTTRRLRLELDILRRYHDQFRGDSYAQIRTGGALLGAPVVYVVPGTPVAPVLAEGAVIPSREQVDLEAFTSDIAIASRQFPTIINNVKLIAKQARTVNAALQGTTGDDAVPIRVVTGRAATLGRSLAAGDGTLGAAMRDGGPLLQRARRAMARADSLQRLLAGGDGTMGRLRADSALLRTVQDARNELSIVGALLAQSRGTAGRALHDSALVRQLRQLDRELGATIEDVKKSPGRYIAF